MPYLGTFLCSEELRRNARFQDMLRRMKLPDRQQS
jgi:hypothetical protein